MYNNTDTNTNGERYFYSTIKDRIKVIFDVGSRYDSEFLDFTGEVHYFEPMKEYLDRLKSSRNNLNIKSYWNNFGLGNTKGFIDYFPKYQSFFNRTVSCGIDESKNKIKLQIQTGKDYILENNIEKIDFMKIDTEGYELNVLKGFDDLLNRVNIIQFEYGGTYLDSGVKLREIVDYLQTKGFYGFSYISPFGTILINDFSDHYQYCNIVCFNNFL